MPVREYRPTIDSSQYPPEPQVVLPEGWGADSFTFVNDNEESVDVAVAIGGVRRDMTGAQIDDFTLVFATPSKVVSLNQRARRLWFRGVTEPASPVTIQVIANKDK
ncbi:MAG: hypothetical protein E6Q97_16935 [Desulfurellales bacterium]|nr:MAG: hypothetical protein E6Q97_16935 [Desulfurellales bacterium]